jgi:hypothetical protein
MTSTTQPQQTPSFSTMPTEGPLIEKQQLKRRKPKIIVNFEENKKLRLKKEVSEIICDETSKKDDVKEVVTPKSLPKTPEKPNDLEDLEFEFN